MIQKGGFMDKRFKILVVDDEADNLQVILSALNDKYEILTALDGHDAISLLTEHKMDLILLDVMMPDINGFEVCKIIKANSSFVDIPVIFLTAMDSLEGARQGLDVGGIDYLTKPVDLDLLKLRVRNHIETKERNDLVKEQRDLLVRQKAELEAALVSIKQLEGIIPICSFCKKIRADQESWQLLEQYFTEHSQAIFCQGVCPDCLEKQLKLLSTYRLPYTR
jgi:DNA-binding response OmpR family regulator